MSVNHIHNVLWKAPMWKHRDFLVKALISSYFKKIVFFVELDANIKACNHSCKKPSYHFSGILLVNRS